MADFLNVKNRITLVVNQSLATIGSGFFDVNVQQKIRFRPTHLVIRQLLYCNIGLGVDNGTFLVWCDLNSDYIGACYVGIQSTGLMSETIIDIKSFKPNMQFRLDNAINIAAVPTGQLTMTLEFIETNNKALT